MSEHLDLLELRATLDLRDATIRNLENELRKAERSIMLLRTALNDAVEKYGKPGGPWNVPSEPGSWIANAKSALKKTKGE